MNAKTTINQVFINVIVDVSEGISTLGNLVFKEEGKVSIKVLVFGTIV